MDKSRGFSERSANEGGLRDPDRATNGHDGGVDRGQDRRHPGGQCMASLAYEQECIGVAALG